MSTQMIKGIALATAVSVGALTLASPAEAGRRHYGAAAAAAIIGLGIGAALASRPHYYDYGYAPYAYAPPPRRYQRPPPVYSYRPAPWTPDWYAYCASKYRSFDRYSGTFQPYHGPRRLCR